MPNSIARFCVAVGLVLSTAPAAAATCQAQSGPGTVALLELYTSEGCSSCPPADRWFAELPSHGLDASRLVRLALHVDYWDYLGWQDPYSRAAYSARQGEVAQRAGARVYTPGIFFSGREYSGWRGHDISELVSAVNRQPARADIRLRLDRSGSQLKIAADATTKIPAGGRLYVAVTENNLHSQVRAGENQGRLLEHASVVRELFDPVAVSATGDARLRRTIALKSDWKTADLGITAFVQDAHGADVLQALALPLCR